MYLYTIKHRIVIIGSNNICDAREIFPSNNAVLTEDNDLYNILYFEIIKALPMASLKNIIGEERKISWRITGTSWAISLNFAPINAITPEKKNTTKNKFMKGKIEIIKLKGLIMPITIRTTNIGTNDCIKE